MSADEDVCMHAYSRVKTMRVGRRTWLHFCVVQIYKCMFSLRARARAHGLKMFLLDGAAAANNVSRRS